MGMKIALLLFSLLISSCANPNLPKQLNRADYPRKETTFDYTAVARIFVDGAMCSGTFVAPKIFLTAAHCVEGKEHALKYSYILSDSGEKYYIINGITGDFRIEEENNFTEDYALLLTDRATTEGYYPIAKKQPRVGSPIAQVGYGCNALEKEDDLTTLGSGVKRVQHATSEEISFSSFDSRSLFACFGDSGGPIIDEEEMAVYLVASELFTETHRGRFMIDRSRYTPVFGMDSLVKQLPKFLSELPPGIILHPHLTK